MESRSDPQVSIVIPVWNKNELCSVLLRRAIASIVNYVKADYELILVDNDSPYPYNVSDLLKQTPSNRNIWFSKNQGFGPACNKGLEVARGDFFVQMNSDCELVEDSVSLLIEVMEKHSIDVGMPEHFENCMVYGLGKSDELMGSDWRFGAMYVARTAIMRKMNGYDPIFKMCYWEDNDLWRRMEAIGGRISGWRGTWISHWGGASSHPERDRYFVENREKFAGRYAIGHV